MESWGCPQGSDADASTLGSITGVVSSSCPSSKDASLALLQQQTVKYSGMRETLSTAVSCDMGSTSDRVMSSETESDTSTTWTALSLVGSCHRTTTYACKHAYMLRIQQDLSPPAAVSGTTLTEYINTATLEWNGMFHNWPIFNHTSGKQNTNVKFVYNFELKNYRLFFLFNVNKYVN